MIEIGRITPEFAKALVKAQGEIEGAKKGKKNPGFQNSKYADLSACWEACRDALHDNEIALLQFPTTAPPGYVGLVGTFVFGPTGETLSESFAIPIKDATNPQAYGSGVTYGRRYQLSSMIGICPVDDDGNAAASPTPKPAAVQPSQVPAVDVEAFASAVKTNDLTAMKGLYSILKNSHVSEPAKTTVLANWAKQIKESIK